MLHFSPRSPLAPLLVLSAALSAQAPQKQTLFDGSTLKGWRGDPAIWSVEDGCLTGSTLDHRIAHNTNLVLDAPPVADFELVLEFRMTGSNNSGIEYRASMFGDDSFDARGYQADIHGGAGLLGSLYVQTGTAAANLRTAARAGEKIRILADGSRECSTLQGAVPQTGTASLDSWHELHVIAKGNRLRHFVDGLPTVDVVDERPDAPRTGHIALQLHGGAPMQVWFRNVRLTRLDALSTDELQTPEWIWPKGRDRATLVKSFELPRGAQNLKLRATCDNHFRLSLDGTERLSGDDWQRVQSVSFPSPQPGTKRLEAEVWNEGGPAGFAFRATWKNPDGTKGSLVSDASWQVKGEAQAEIEVLGAVGDRLPWTGNVGRSAFGLPAPPEPPQTARPLDDLELREGFEAEELFAVPGSMGSWVAMAAAPNDMLYASDQRRGLYRVFVANDDRAETSVERVDVDLPGGAQGLCWAYDSLYAVVSYGDPGLYRLRDTDSDGKLDSAEKLKGFDGTGEHGPHAVVLHPDGDKLVVVIGNHVDLVEGFEPVVPGPYETGVVLPRKWDARGHAKGRLAPGGAIYEVSPDGQDWALIATGFRNTYDVAISKTGVMTTFDSDMEWDMGMPWYRPTRIVDVVPGTDYGWRAGTAKWADHWIDTLPPYQELGAGSPTGMLHGEALRGWPKEFQESVFALDWTFGTVWQVADPGSSQRFDPKPFLYGAPLPLADATASADGRSMLLLTGGRGLPTRLIRVSPKQPINWSTDIADASMSLGSLRKNAGVRLKGLSEAELLEALSQRGRRVNEIRAMVRYELERRPVEKWRNLDLSGASDPALLHFATALARQGGAADLPKVLDALNRVQETADPDPRLRVLMLAHTRLGPLPEQARAAWFTRLSDTLTPPGRVDRRDFATVLAMLDPDQARERVLNMMEAASVQPIPDWAERLSRNDKYGKTIRAMLESMPPTDGIHYARVLTTIESGWTERQRERQFGFFVRAAQHPGGLSYAGFLEGIREDALATCTPEERAALGELATVSLQRQADVRAIAPMGPGRAWTIDSAFEAIDGQLEQADLARGQGLFHGLACAACHRVDGGGGALGPDLTALPNRFGLKDVLKATIEPGRDRSDQYSAQMPAGLINALSPTELRDLMGFLLSDR